MTYVIEPKGSENIRVVHFFDYTQLSTSTLDTKYLVPTQVDPLKKVGIIISKKEALDTPKVYVVPICTDEGEKSDGLPTYLVKMVRFCRKTQ